MRRAAAVTQRIGTGTSADPYRPQLDVDYDDTTGQPLTHILVSKNAYTVTAHLSDDQLAAINADNRFVVLWDVDADAPDPTTDLSAEEIAALQASLENIYYSDVAKLVTLDSSKPTDISAELIAVQLRPPWQAGITVLVGEVYQYSGNVYEVIQAHTTQADWTPDKVPALFKRFYEPSDDPWPWVQPQGAHDAYPIGAKVTHNGYIWESNTAANVWEPGVYGWDNLTQPPTPEWSYPVAYKIGDEVTYQGHTYECRQAHTSQVDWTPPVVPALWLLLL